MAGTMWFGVRGHMQAVPCPAVGADYGRKSSVTSFQYRNGGSRIRRSLSGARTYDLTWNRAGRDELQPIVDYAEGVYGPGPYYWTDPFANDKNVLPQSFATPSLGGYDGVILNNGVRRPELVATAANSRMLPRESAVYLNAGESEVQLWVPIPPGYDLVFGAIGINGSGGAVHTRPTARGVATGTGSAVTLIAPTTDTRFNRRISSADGYDGALIYLAGTGTVTLTGMMAQLIPTGDAMTTGSFYSGRGHSGCEFTDVPTIEAYSVALDMVGLSANLEEVGQWR